MKTGTAAVDCMVGYCPHSSTSSMESWDQPSQLPLHPHLMIPAPRWLVCWLLRLVKAYQIWTKLFYAQGTEQKMLAGACEIPTHSFLSFYLYFQYRRLQHHIELGKPNVDDIECILRCYLCKLSCHPDLSLQTAVQALHALAVNGSEVECFARNALMHAIREQVQQIEQIESSNSNQDKGKNTSQDNKDTGQEYAQDEDQGNDSGQDDKQHYQCQQGQITQAHIDATLLALVGETAQQQQTPPPPPVIVENSSTGKENAFSFTWTGDFSLGT